MLMVSDYWFNGYPYLWMLVLRHIPANCWLLNATGMQTLRHQQHSISLTERVPMWLLPKSCGHPPAEVSASFSLLMSTAVQTLPNLHHSIPLNRQISTHPAPMLSDRWLKSYPCFCPLVPRTTTFKLLATTWYRHVDTSRPIPFNFPHWADSNASCPCLVR